jgi:hypothetical protein
MHFSGVNRSRDGYLWRSSISRGKSVPRLKSSPATEITGAFGTGRGFEVCGAVPLGRANRVARPLNPWTPLRSRIRLHARPMHMRHEMASVAVIS